MKRILLMNLDICKFKGLDALTLDFQGRPAVISGRNGTGKTSVYDALTWLLFGRDSQGASNPETFKPRNRDGDVCDHAAVTSVEAAFSVDGQPLTLKRTLFEKWSAKRGGSERSYDGNTSEYFIDGVPVKKYAFDARVGELAGESLFRTLTDIKYFCGIMNWKERRDLLFEICQTPDDRTVIESDEQFAELAEILAEAGNWDVDALKKRLLARRKSLNGARDSIPARLDEQEQIIKLASGTDFTALHASRDEKSARLEELSGELLKLNHGAWLDSKRNELVRIKNEMDALENENERHRNHQSIAAAEDRRPEYQAALQRERDALTGDRVQMESEQARTDRLQAVIEGYRAGWMKLAAETFTASVCPTCGQSLPERIQAEARARFDRDRKDRMDKIVAAASLDKEALRAAREHIQILQTGIAAHEQEITRMEENLRQYIPPVPHEVTDLPDYRLRMARLQEQIRGLQEEIRLAERERDTVRAEITNRTDTLRQEIRALDSELAKEGYLALARQRAEELRLEAQKTALELENLDRGLDLCDRFIWYKVRYIERTVNSRFRMVTFRLFEEQINGGLTGCCKAMVDGVPYGGGLNQGACFNAGIDVIDVLSRYYGCRVPLFLDQTESVNDILPIDTQVIRLRVSEHDYQLRCDYENQRQSEE